MSLKSFSIFQSFKIPYSDLISVELPPTRSQYLTSLHDYQLPMKALNSFQFPKNMQQLRLFIPYIPNFDRLIITTTEQSKLTIMRKSSNQRLMSLDLLIYKIILIYDSAIVRTLIKRSSDVNRAVYTHLMANCSMCVFLYI